MDARRVLARGVLGTAAVLASALGAMGCSSGPTGPDPATARADVGAAYRTLFDFADPSVTAKTAVVEDGSALVPAITSALGSSLAKAAAGARVDDVRILTGSGCSAKGVQAPCATVKYDLLGPGGAPLFASPSAGLAVFRDGRWLVAKSTICGLLELFYSASGRAGTPPGC